MNKLHTNSPVIGHTDATLLAPATALASRLGASVDLLYVADVGTPPDEPGSIGAPQYVDQPQHEWPQLCAACEPLEGAPPDLVRGVV